MNEQQTELEDIIRLGYERNIKSHLPFDGVPRRMVVIYGRNRDYRVDYEQQDGWMDDGKLITRIIGRVRGTDLEMTFDPISAPAEEETR